MSQIDKFDRLAHGFSERDYADPVRYGRRRAEVVIELCGSPPRGSTVLDLACGDGNLAGPLLARGYRYRGVDGSAAMIAEARAHLGESVALDVGLIEEYAPPEAVDVTVCLRSVYQMTDRRALFGRVAGYTRRRFVFDFDPRAYDRRAIDADLRASGFERIEYRPFFLPQRVAVPAPLRTALVGLEHAGPLARAALRVRGIYFCAASPSRART